MQDIQAAAQSNAQTIANNYLAVWNEADAERRRAALARTWAADARYSDPRMAGEGHDQLATMIENARAQFPGHGFLLRGMPDGHGRFVRFSWSLAPVGGAPVDGAPVGGGAPADEASVAGGTDVVRLDEGGRIAEVIGFLDAVPAGR